MKDDKTLADIARRLAEALAKAGHTREPSDKKDVLALQTELCAQWRKEQQDDDDIRS